MDKRIPATALIAALASTGTWGLVASDAGATTADAAVAFAFDEGSGSVVADASGHDRTGTLTSTTWTSSGRSGSALVFDGARSRARTSTTIEAGSSFSVTMWVLNPSASGYETLASVGSARDLYLLDGRLYLLDGDRDLDLGADVPTGRWVQVAVTADGSALRSYVDGALAGTVPVALVARPAAVLQLGAWASPSGNSDWFSGRIDELRWYDRALTATEIAADGATSVAGGGTTTTAPPTSSTSTTVAPATTTTTVAPATTTTTVASGTNRSLRFYGNGYGGIDRVRIPLTPNRSIDVGGNFTIEWWMKIAGPLTSGSCGGYESGWIYGNILLDRDVYGGGDNGDYGVSVFGGGGGRIGFGVTRGSNGVTLCSSVGVADGAWHHVAVTRSSSSGSLAMFVDGQPAGTASGPTGDVSYRDGRSTSYANDPMLVIGAEKHDAGSAFPSYPGWLDELRISNSVRYTGPFSPPRARLSADGSTVALYHADEGGGTVLQDATGANPGSVLFGGSPAGPEWSTDAPF